MAPSICRFLALLTLITVALFAFEPRATHATPTASDADPPYPLNHTFDGDTVTLSGPSNTDFETSGGEVGTPPDNYDLEDDAEWGTDLPTNNDFETGDFTGWTTSGTTSIGSDSTYYGKAGSSGKLTTSAFDVDSDAQTLSFRIGFMSSSSTAAKVYVLHGEGYGTSTQVGYYTCTSSSCKWNWYTKWIDAEPYRGESIKMKFERYITGTVGVDDVGPLNIFPGFDTADGPVYRYTSGTQGEYAQLDNGATLTSPAITVEEDAQYGQVRIHGPDSLDRSQYKIWVLSGESYETSTLAIVDYAENSWNTISFNITDWIGESIKIQIEEIAYNVNVDDIGVQWTEVPEWRVEGTTTIEDHGGGGHYIETDDQITTKAFTVPTDVQQISFDYKSGNGSTSTFYAELLYGTNFSQTQDLAGYQGADPNDWQTLKVGISDFAGQTVKFRLRRWSGVMQFDDAGINEITVPGWTLNTTDGVVYGSDSNGTYVTPSEDGGTFYLNSSDISAGIIDRQSIVDRKYFKVAYAIGDDTGSLIRVKWYNDQAQNWVVFLDSADTPTGYTEGYFYIADFNGDTGYFEVQVTEGGKVYSIGDNVARQHMREPFSEKVGLEIDTSTGAFGFRDTDLVTQGRVPLVFTRYYNGHSDHFGALGYRWTHTYDTHLEFAGDDVGVVYGSGGEEFFIWDVGQSEFYAADTRVKNELTESGGTYTLTTKHGVEYNFDSEGKLTTIVDRNDNTITLSYDMSDRLEEVEDPDGRTLTFAYDGNGRLSTVTDPIRETVGTAESGTDCGTAGTGNGVDDDSDTVVDDGCPSVKYTYDASGDLVTVTDGEAEDRTYTYDKHRLTSFDDQNDDTVFTNSFDSINRAVEQTDALSNTIAISYDDPAKGVTTVTDPESNDAEYYFDEFGRTTDKVDPLSNVISYIYDGSGNLDKIVDPNFDEWDFAYDGDANVTDIEDPLGNPVSITYNAEHLPTTVTDARGYTTYMTYDGDGNLETVTDPTRETVGTSEAAISGCGTEGTGDGVDDDSDTVIDDGCPSMIYTYDTDGNVLTETDALGRVTTYTYDGSGNRITKTDPLDNVWEYTYDAAGRMLTETDPLDHTTTYTYDLFGRPLAEENELEEQWIYLYDPAGHLLMVEDPLENQTLWDYDERGLVERKIDAEDYETHYTYDANRNMVTVTEPIRLAVGDPEEGGECGSNKTGDGVDDDSDTVIDDGCPSMYYTYDENNRVETITDATGGITTYTYDDAGRVLSEEDPVGRTTSHTYDDAGRVLTMTLPNDGVWEYTYDENGNLLTEEDPLDNVTSYTYDALNRRVSATDALRQPNATPESGADCGTEGTGDGEDDDSDTVIDDGCPSALYVYDPAGQLLEMVDALGNLTAYAYDDAGRMTSITDPLDNVREFEYDAAGRRATVIDPLDRETSYGYDDANRLTSITRPGSFTTTYAYDDAGRMTSVAKPEGGVTTYDYDARGLMTALTNPLRQAVSTPESGADCGSEGTGDGEDDDSDTVVDDGCASTIYTYDDSGRRTSATDALGRVTGYAYDDASRMIAMTDALDGVVSFGYDAAGQRTSVTKPMRQPNGTPESGADCGASGTGDGDDDDSDTIVDDGCPSVIYTYGDLGNRATQIDPLGSDWSWSYDAAGNLSSTTDARDITVSYGYDARNQLIDVTHPGGDVDYEYDALGRRTQMDDDTGITYWYYDDSSRVTSVAAPAGTIGYTYDDAGDRLTMTLPNSRTLTYAYSATTGRLSSITDWDSNVISFTYDDNGNRTLIERPNGVDSTYTYDLADRLTSIDHFDTGGTIQSFDYTLDAVGNRTAVTTTAGTESYTLDDLNRVTDIDYISGDDVEYTYDENGNILTMTVGMTTTTYTHNTADQLTSDGTDSYTHDANGNLTDAGSDEFTWDYRNMMTSATIDSTTTDYEYDGDGVRVSKETTDYLWDRESGLPMLVDDETNAYLHEGGALASIDGSDVPSYLLDDGLGSVRGVTDDAGDLVGTADYNVFGEVRASSGVSTLFRFTGEQYDGETGFTYLRARYMSPAVGRFVSADSVQPNAPGTQGWNLYAYVANNPTTWVDPSGHVLGISDPFSAFFTWFNNPNVYVILTLWMRESPGAGATVAFAHEQAVERNPTGLAWGIGAIGVGVVAWLLGECLSNPACIDAIRDLPKILADFGSPGGGGGGGGGGPDCMDPLDIVQALDDLLTLVALGESGIPPGQDFLDIDFGKGKPVSASQADSIGRQWVGANYDTASDGKILLSEDGFRKYRPPTLKKESGVTRANLEWRFKTSGPYPGDAHIEIDHRC